ncbi:MAG: ABC transporter permease [Planctomycetaceae bacterium]
MKKILTIARREYQAMVGTKAFIIGLAMMPVLMAGGMFIPGLLKGLQKSEVRRIAVIDHTGELFDALNAAADQKNLVTQILQGTATGDATADVSDHDREEKAAKEQFGLDDINTYLLEPFPAADFGDEQRLQLSDDVRSGRLHAFVEIPGDLTKPPAVDLSEPKSLQLPESKYYSEDAALSDVKRWIQTTINQIIRTRRLTESGISPQTIVELERQAPVAAAGLFARDDSGSIVSEAKPDELTSLFLPMGVMMLMFMILMMSAQPMLESVLEEKTLRITEVLLGSANARQLMTGKLLGNVGGSLTVFSLYGFGAYALANYKGYADNIPFHVVPWFVIYQVLAVLFFSSIFMAIGASVSQLKEAQGLLMPVWMMLVLPMMVWFNVVREPNGTLALALSFFPPSTPMMMVLRLATGANVPFWQIAVSILIMLVSTAVIVTAASRIYRAGILWQGKTPKLWEMAAWIVRNPAK